MERCELPCPFSSVAKMCEICRFRPWLRRNLNGTVTNMSYLHADSHLGWRRSSRSIGTGDCVEAVSRLGEIAVRDSKDPAGPTLRYPVSAWRAFVGRLKES